MKFHHPDITSASHEGETFEADEHGIIDAPAGAAEAFAAFGLLPWKEPKAASQVNPRPVPQWSNDDLKAKATELNLDVEGLDRPALIQAVTTALKGQD